MTTAHIRAMLAATGIVAGLVAGPAMADLSRAEEQGIARSLAEHGYSGVRIRDTGEGVRVSARREGATHSFAYDAAEGRLDPVGGAAGGDRPRDTGRPGPEGDAGGKGDGPGHRGGDSPERGGGDRSGDSPGGDRAEGGDTGQGGGGDRGGGSSEGGHAEGGSRGGEG